MKKIDRRKISSIILFLIGFIGLIGVIAFDKFYFRIGFFTEGWPIFSVDHIFRCIIISISIFSMVWALTGAGRQRIRLDDDNNLALERFSILAVMFLSVVFLLLFILNPLKFSILSYEDGLIEWASAILLFVSCIIVIISVFATRGSSDIPKGTSLSLIILSLLFFLIGMEEVSWFQRVLEFESPKVFHSTYRKEINFHNFATNKFENFYYFSVFVFLVVFPFVRFIFSSIAKNKYCKIILPRPFIAVIASIICAYNFDMWNNLFTQVAFWGSVAILSKFFMSTINKSDKYTILFTVLLVVVTQLIFLNNGANFARIYEVTEYKEFFIPLAFFIYSVDMFVSIKRLRQPEKD